MDRIVLIPGKLAKVATKFCADAARPTFANAKLQNGRLIATNGHILLDKLVSEEAVTHEAWTIPAKVLAALKASDTLRVNVDTGSVHVLDRDGVVTATLQDLERAPSPLDVGKVIPKEPSAWEVGFDPAYLVHVGNLALALGTETLFFESIVSDGPQDRAIRLVTREGERVGLLMPKIRR